MSELQQRGKDIGLFLCFCAVVLALCNWILLINARTHPRDIAEEKYNKNIPQQGDCNKHTCLALVSYHLAVWERQPVDVLTKPSPQLYPSLCATHSSPLLSFPLSLPFLCFWSRILLFPHLRFSSGSLSTAFGCVYVPAIGKHLLINIHSSSP